MKTTLFIEAGIFGGFTVSICSDADDGFRVLAVLTANKLKFSHDHKKLYYYTASDSFGSVDSVFAGSFPVKSYDTIDIQEGIEIPTEGGDE